MNYIHKEVFVIIKSGVKQAPLAATEAEFFCSTANKL
jgi:hypothetical protein